MPRSSSKSSRLTGPLLAAGSATGKAAVWAGRYVARQAVAAYRKIDPDVPRHLVQMPLLTYCLIGRGHQKIVPGVPDGHPPLIFVHGLLGVRGDVLLMAQYLKLKGRRRSYRIKFKGGQTIDQMAASLARFIRDVRAATGEKKVDVVAHSLGGLIARAAVIRHGLQNSVNILITLGAPHAGTHPARYLRSKVVSDLRPDSPFLKKLNRKPWPKAVRGVTFWSRNDLFILPPESATVKGMEAVEVTPFTHYSYLIDPLCWSRVAGILKA